MKRYWGNDTNKKWLAIGCILLVFGVLLFISGGGYRQKVEDDRNTAIYNYYEAVNNYDFDGRVYWMQRMVLLNMTKDFDNGLPVFLEVTGFLMAFSSFFILLGGVYKEEKPILKKRNCPDCGMSIPFDAETCPNCDDKSDETTTGYNKFQMKLLLIILIIIACLAVISAIGTLL